MNFYVNESKAFICGIIVAFFAGFGTYYLVTAAWVPAVVFLIIALIFAYVLYLNASKVTINRDGLVLCFFGHVRKAVFWETIEEVGIIGEKLFGNKKKYGDEYIYFSPNTMTEQERFNMVLRWPPRDMIYVSYSEKAQEQVQLHWSKELVGYNADNIIDTTKDAPIGPEESE